MGWGFGDGVCEALTGLRLDVHHVRGTGAFPEKSHHHRFGKAHMRTSSFTSIVLASLFLACGGDGEDSAGDSQAEMGAEKIQGEVTDVDGAELGDPHWLAQAKERFPESRAFGREQNDVWRLQAGRMVVRLDDAEIRMQYRDGDDSVGVSLESWGRGSKQSSAELSILDGLAGPTGQVDRLSAQGNGIEQWYRGTPFALQQGWTISDRLAGSELLSLELGVDASFVETDGRTAWLESGGDLLVEVTGLVAWDAEQTRLDAWFESDGTDLSIRLDDTDAVYPVTVDPWYSSAGTDIQHNYNNNNEYDSMSSLT
ncbi:MAG: hypothetical protein VX519_02255, partial [Myxococcota bacterium]|nr:hypothetical protein [Myxococcota bacterium]